MRRTSHLRAPDIARESGLVHWSSGQPLGNGAAAALGSAVTLPRKRTHKGWHPGLLSRFWDYRPRILSLDRGLCRL